MFPRMKKKPRRVTMLGAIHRGSHSTNVFHCGQARQFLLAAWQRTPHSTVHGGKSRTQGPSTYFDTGDLSTLEYLYDLRCASASSETHSAAACPAPGQVSTSLSSSSTGAELLQGLSKGSEEACHLLALGAMPCPPFSNEVPASCS